MAGSFIAALAFVINALTQLYLLILLIRFLLPFVGANFQNALAQAILKLTSPLVVPLRRILPPIGRIDTATVVVAYAIQYLLLLVLAALSGRSVPMSILAPNAAVSLVLLMINLFIFAILIRVILSWFASGSYNPAIAVLHTLTEPVLRPFRRIIPTTVGFDISPLFAMIGLGALSIIVGGLMQPM